MTIPEALQNPEFRFIKVKAREKIPVEKSWPTKNYCFDDPELTAWIDGGGNYGICGGFGGLLAVDFDELTLYDRMKDKLPKSLTILTGSGKYHVYYFCDDATSKKAGGGKIDVQGKGKFVVAPGSTHPNGQKYSVFKDVPIARIERDVLDSVLNPLKKAIKKDAPVKENLVTEKPVDESESGKTFGRVLALLKEGYDKEQIFSLMQEKRKVKDEEGKTREEFIWTKWQEREDYRELTYSNAIKTYQLERDSHLPLLKRPDLMDVLDAELDKKIVDERETRRSVLLVALGGSLTANCAPASTNLMVNDASGAGKDYICKSVLDLLPKFKVVSRKRISEKVFTYWHNAKFEPAWTWDGKVFYNEDISNALLNCDVFKVMSTSDGVNHSTVIIKQQLVEIITKGKPVMLITVAHARPKDELLRRFPICNLDTTEDQTRKIVKRKAHYHKFGFVPGYDSQIIQSLGFLKRVKVKIPFADKLENALDTRHIIIRTHFDRFMDYIKFSCAIHQYQRIEEDSYLLAEKQDYEIASQALLKTTSNVFSVPLTKNQQRIIEILKNLKEGVSYSVSELEPHVTFIGDRTLRIELDRLAEYGFLSKDKEDRENSKKPVMVYCLNKISQMHLPAWESVENASIDTIDANDSNDSNDSNDTSFDGTNESNESNAGQLNDEKLQIEEENLT